MSTPNGDKPGTGGGLRYLTEEALPSMVNQEQSHSCQAACARQLLRDAGIDISEADLLAKIGYYEGIGTLAKPTAAILSKLHPKLIYEGGEIPQEALAVLFKRDPWIVILRTERGQMHAVVVDGLDGDTVHVRDPWGLEGPGSGTGTKATMQLNDFLEHWHWGYYTAVFPNSQK
jgi:predicted double-glycine peptidase